MATQKSAVENNELPDYILELLNDITCKEGFTEYTIVTSSGSNHGDGYMGIMSRVTIEGQKDGKDDKLILMLKMPPKSNARREQYNSKAVFIREIYMYTKVLPLFAEFQKERGLTGKNGFYSFPKCFGTINDEENERYAIVMEDIKANGYDMWNRFAPIDKEHVVFVMEELGKLHAISFAMQDQQPQLFESIQRFEDVMVIQMINMKDLMMQYMNTTYDRIIETLDSTEAEARDKIRDIKETFTDVLKTCVDQNVAAPFHVVNHGDCWNNNMMFLYDEGKTPQSVCFYDWQITRIASPVLDLVYFLFTATNKELRDSNYQNFIEIYYSYLAKTVAALGSDPEKLFTFDNLRNELKKFGKFALLMVPMVLQIITTKPEDIPDLDELAETLAEGNIMEMPLSNEVYTERIRDVVRDVLDLGYY